MKLFSKKTKLPEPLNDREVLPGVIEKEKSYMFGVPGSQQDIENIDVMLDRIKQNDEFEILAKSTGESPCVVIKYQEEDYSVEFKIMDFQIPELFSVNHEIDEESMNILKSSKRGVCVSMLFGSSNLNSYHLQLKILSTIIPNLIAVVDFSCEKIFSGKWAKLAAESKVPPAPTYLYTVQAVAGKQGAVWLHSHGLNRCGGIELEIVDSNKEKCNSHYNIIMAMAGRIIADEEFISEEEPLYIAQLPNDINLVATWVDWRRVMPNMGRRDVGGPMDRIGEGHNGHTGIVYLYATEEDYQQKIFSSVSIYDKEPGENLLVMITTEETARMKALANERIDILKDCVRNRQAEALIKVGLKTDEKYEMEEGFREHIWFELIELKENGFVARLTQETYYVDALKSGDVLEIPYEDITDWIMLVDEQRVTPDLVYLIL